MDFWIYLLNQDFLFGKPHLTEGETLNEGRLASRFLSVNQQPIRVSSN